MKNYLSIGNPNAIAIGSFLILCAGYFLGIRFWNVYVNGIIGLLLYIFPIYVLVLLLSTELKNKTLKISLSILFGLLSLGTLLFILFGAFDLYTISHNGGANRSFEEVSILDVNSTKVVVYRTDGGAMSDFGVVVRTEKPILPGVYIEHDLLNIYGVDNVSLSPVAPNSIEIDSINFVSPQYQSEYMSSDPKIIDGTIIKL